jgi:hypothetical protein
MKRKGVFELIGEGWGAAERVAVGIKAKLTMIC